ncbi:ParB/RepB/Spo0J family partition protein [Thalassobacillus sp. CUG 92003]|uniref:ParB/RepB/Spo0J family partition protein n=1 Tax=Thalassobacillus sp. CUG 92003 TaxID=2736641 RepID=UPI0015E69E72|nr:ParB/RepB/Spo0J family partition protein [Thalassobacillus sp. CUG 92003]
MAKGLGKGINAFFPEVEEHDDTQIEEVAVKVCRPNPYQPRKTFSQQAIEELKQSIEQHGILQPIIIRKSIKGYEIVVGERRYRAAKEAGLEVIPAVVKELTDEEMMELALLENLQREDLTPIEEAMAYKNLTNELGITQEELSKRLGKSRSHIANIVRLLALPDSVIAKINEGKLSMGHGRAILGLKHERELAPLLKRIEKEGMNVRQLERLIADLNETKPKEKKSRPEKDIFTKEREETLQERLGTGVKIHKGKRKGRIEIEFMSDDDLNRILDFFEQSK